MALELSRKVHFLVMTTGRNLGLLKQFIDMYLKELITLIALIFDVPQFTCDLFLEMSVQLKEKDM